MRNDDFEWDPSKARRNRAKHGVSFETAKKAFADPLMVEILDDRENYGEERYLLIGMADGQLLSIIYTERQGRFRIIMARRSTKDEQDHYFAQDSQD
jgi:uncharacterized DUF497 family protein